MGRANVKKWVDDIMPLLIDHPRAVFEQAAHAYEIFQKKQDGAVKIILKP